MRPSLAKTVKDIRVKIEHYRDKGHTVGTQRYQAVLEYILANPKEFR